MDRLLHLCDSPDADQELRLLKEVILETKPFWDNPKGNALIYQQVMDALPEMIPTCVDLDRDRPVVGCPSDVNTAKLSALAEGLKKLCPWRKGPFDLFGIQLDAEWESWMKWNRLRNRIQPLKNRRILDIGSSNGYYMFRMAASDPRMVLGLEPQHTFYYQYRILQKYIRKKNLFSLPLPFDELPVLESYFDTIFCMGVLSHRRSPLAMLRKIYRIMKPGGELVLENLVIETDDDICLFPKKRYAKMRNIFFIPSVSVLISWLRRSGFCQIECVDVSRTRDREQRKTSWIQTESLGDYLDPEDREKTVEGYPAPVRAMVTARVEQ